MEEYNFVQLLKQFSKNRAQIEIVYYNNRENDKIMTQHTS